MHVHQIPFYKLSGTGNDFIVIDNRGNILKEEQKSPFSKKVCDRRRSLGADGVILLEPSETAHFYMRLFNADGREGEMCGNGARCIAYFAHQKGLAPASMVMDTLGGMVEAEVNSSMVKINLWETEGKPAPMDITVGGKSLKVYFMELGVPHVVICTPDLNGIDTHTLEKLGREVRYHKIFPNGTNVNFLEIVDANNIIVRTYERGVEAETLACGTGSITSAMTARTLDKRMVFPLRVHARGGLLEVSLHFRSNPERAWQASLSGEVRAIAEGHILPGGYLWEEVDGGHSLYHKQ